MLKVPRCTAFGRFTLNGGAEHERQTQTGRHLYTFHTEKLLCLGARIHLERQPAEQNRASFSC